MCNKAQARSIDRNEIDIHIHWQMLVCVCVCVLPVKNPELYEQVSQWAIKILQLRGAVE